MIAIVAPSLRTSSQEDTMNPIAIRFRPSLAIMLAGIPALFAACEGPLDRPAGAAGVEESPSSPALTLEAAQAPQPGQPVGAVYVATNKFSGNEIVSFLRLADGSLK